MSGPVHVEGHGFALLAALRARGFLFSRALLQFSCWHVLQSRGTKSLDAAAVLLRHPAMGKSGTDAATSAAANERTAASELPMDHDPISDHHEMLVWVLDSKSISLTFILYSSSRLGNDQRSRVPLHCLIAKLLAVSLRV